MPLREYHFSVDDVFQGLLEASERRQGLFEHEFFGFLKQLHDRFEATVDLYLFLQQKAKNTHQTLSDVSDALQPFFRDSPWIRFGPHALDDGTPPYSQRPEELQAICESIYAHIARVAGEDRTSRWVRLHYFSECYELASYFRSHAVDAMLSTDKPAVSYRLPRDETEQLRLHGSTTYAGIQFVKSHVRVENLVGRLLDDRQLDAELERLCAGSTCAVILTHEYELERTEVREMAFRIFAWIQRRQLKPINQFASPSQVW